MLSPSMKSDSDSVRPANKWRLRKTLRRRNTDLRQIEPDDMRYLWAAYKLGKLSGLALPEGMSADEFAGSADQKLSQHCQMGWTMLADDKVVGFVFGAHSPFNAFIEILLVIWMPWASKRTIIESTIGFISHMRNKHNFMGCATPENKRLYEVAAMHGLVCRIGTSYIVIPGKATAIFESRKPD